MRLIGAVSLDTSVLIMCAKSLKKSLGIRRIAQSRLYCVVSWRVNAGAVTPILAFPHQGGRDFEKTLPTHRRGSVTNLRSASKYASPPTTWTSSWPAPSTRWTALGSGAASYSARPIR